MREPDREGDSDSRLPWAFVLDPAANVRALGEVQRRGLSAARELVDRVTSAMDAEGRHRPSGGPRAGVRSNGAGWGTAQPDLVNQLVQGWWELTMNTLTAFTGSRSNPPGRSSPERPVPSITVDVTRGPGSVSWRLTADSRGNIRSDAELWLQNPSAENLGSVRLSVGDLRAESGAVIRSGRVRMDPSRIRSLPARSGRCVVPEMQADEPIVPGTFRGLLQVEGATRFELPIDIVVEGADRTGANAGPNGAGPPPDL